MVPEHRLFESGGAPPEPRPGRPAAAPLDSEPPLHVTYSGDAWKRSISGLIASRVLLLFLTEMNVVEEQVELFFGRFAEPL